MHRLFQHLRPLIRFATRRAAIVVLVALALAALGLWQAMNLRIDTNLANLIPQDYPSVQALERLRDTVGGESDVSVGIVAEDSSPEQLKAFAEAFMPLALALEDPRTGEPYLSRVRYYQDNSFMRANALYFATPAELGQLETYLDDQVREAKEEANPFFFDIEDDLLEEEGADAEADSVGLALKGIYDRIVGREYPISDDSTTLVLRFYPSGAQTDLGFISRLYRDLEDLAETTIAENAEFAGLEPVLAGRMLRQLTEVEAIENDVQRSLTGGVLAVLLLVSLYFAYKSYRARGTRGRRRSLVSQIVRLPILALLIGLPLGMSLAWTFGLAYVFFETLNLMTATLALVLFGLGVDYGIHFYARYAEERRDGARPEGAAETTFMSTGQAVTVGALSTSAALFVLAAADFRGFSEFGVIAGIGILLALVAMLVVLPAMLVLFERFRLLALGDGRSAVDRPAEAVRGARFPFAKPILALSAVAVVLSIVLLPRVEFEWDFGELEPVYTDYVERARVIDRVYGGTGGGRNPAYVVVDSPEEAPLVAEVLRGRMEGDTTIARVETLQERFPLSAEGQAQRLGRIAGIRAQLEDPFLVAEAEVNPDIARLREAASTDSAIALDEVPEFLRQQFVTKDGDFGTFVMVYPAQRLADGRNSIAFAERVGQVTLPDGRTYQAASTTLVSADMLSLLQAEAPWMVLATFVIVAILMGINFGSVRWAALAVIPLVVGILWMLLLMEIFGLKLTFYNLIVLPAVLGIGNDAGAHLVHRYREEGAGSLRYVLRSTGEHVTVGSLTTMIGFAGQLLSFHPGLHSIGILAVVGIGATLLAALLFLPALLQVLEDRRGAKVAA
jgi:predicted RND superfamily exporter protein